MAWNFRFHNAGAQIYRSRGFSQSKSHGRRSHTKQQGRFRYRSGHYPYHDFAPRNSVRTFFSLSGLFSRFLSG